MKKIGYILFFALVAGAITRCKTSHKPCESYGNHSGFAPTKKVDSKKYSEQKYSTHKRIN